MAPQSTANNSEGRRMIRAPKIEDCNLSRPVHRLRSRSYAQIQLEKGLKSLDSTGQNANRQKDRKTHAVIDPMSPENSARTGRAKAIRLLKSP